MMTKRYVGEYIPTKTDAGFWSKEDDDKIRQMRQNGYSIRNIAPCFKVTYSQLARHVSVMGVDRFPRRRVPLDDIDDIVMLYRIGTPIKKIAERFNLSLNQVRYVIQKSKKENGKNG